MSVEMIKKFREENNLSQEGLARLLGVGWGTISRWERGISKPSPLAISKIQEMMQEKRL